MQEIGLTLGCFLDGGTGFVEYIILGGLTFLSTIPYLWKRFSIKIMEMKDRLCLLTRR